MDHNDKSFWDSKYAESPEKWLEPDPFLIWAHARFLANVDPGLALDVAGGAGRQAIWLARQGWRVRIVDFSDVGLKLAQANAIQSLGASRATESIICEARDLRNSQDLGHETCDLVVIFRFLHRRLFPALMTALKPGGTLIYSTYTLAQQKFAKGPHDASFLLQPDELRQAFARFEILHYRETVTDKATAELVARKPC